MSPRQHVSQTPIFDQMGGQVAVQRLSSAFVVARRDADKAFTAAVADKPARKTSRRRNTR